jgi:hypothetical protein
MEIGFLRSGSYAAHAHCLRQRKGHRERKRSGEATGSAFYCSAL